MKLRGNGFVGISLGDKSIACAEVAGGDRPSVRRVAMYTIAPGLSLENPAALGQALGAFLRDKQIGAQRAVVGLPARWLIALEREIPPAGEEQAAAMLRLAAERLAVAENGELVFDFVGTPDPAAAQKVLLAGMLRPKLDQIRALCDAAGLELVGVSSAALTLAAGLAKADPNMPLLLLARGGAEFIPRSNGLPRMLRHLSLPASNGHMGALGSELSRALATTSFNGAGLPRQMLVVDSAGLAGGQLEELSQRLGLELKSGDVLPMLGVQADAGAMSAGGAGLSRMSDFGPAIALALAGGDRAALPVDFTRSRLTAPPRRRFSPQTVWAAAIGGLVLLLTLGLYIYVQALQSDLDNLNTQTAKMKDQIAASKTRIERVNRSKPYFDARPPMLEALREVTLCFKDNEKIWATSFVVHDNTARLVGKAADKSTAEALLSRLSADKHFTNVHSLDMRDTGGQSRDVTFSFSFNFGGLE